MLRLLTFLLLILGPGIARPAWASHLAGGSITYTSLGGNSYRVRADLFRDCSALAPPASVALSCHTSCGAVATPATLSLIGTPFIDTPYNSTIQPMAICPAGGAAPFIYPNFATYRYEGTVTLLPNRWTLAVEEAVRIPTANLVTNTALRLEATLDNRTLANTSVVFSNVPVFFIPLGQLTNLHIGAFDADGDSLSYAMARPQSGCGSYEVYSTYPLNCVADIIPNNPSCRILCPVNLQYSARLPIFARVDIFGTCPTLYFRPHVDLDSLAGALSFTPTRYLNTPAAQGDNKYAVAVQVTEWRRVNGSYVAVGTTRRDMLWVVCQSAGSNAPQFAPSVTVQHGSQTRTQALATPIAVQAGEPVSVSFTASSPVAPLPLAFTLEQNTVPGAIIQAGATAGTGRLTFTPPLSLPSGTYRVSLTVADDDAPYRNITTVPVTFHVYRAALATRSTASAAISAYPTPFIERVQFQPPTSGVQQLIVHDQLGRVVARLTSQPDGQVQWTPGPGIPAGLYSARTADGRLTVRLLRQAD